MGEGPAGRLGAIHIIWAVLALVWGSTWLFIKVGLSDLPPFTFGGVRFFIAVIPLLPILHFRGQRMPRAWRDWLLLAATGLLSFGGSYGLVFWGEQYISSGLTAILFSTFPLFGLLFAHLLLPSEPVTLRKLSGVVLGILGVVAIFADQLKVVGEPAVRGSLAIVLSAVCGALSGVLLKKWGMHLDPAVVTVGQMSVGGLPLLLMGFVLEGGPFAITWTIKGTFCLLYLALVGTSLAFVLWYRLLRATQVTRAQIMPLLNTVVAVLLGWVFLKESYGIRGIAGGAAVLLGTAVTLSAPKRNEAG